MLTVNQAIMQVLLVIFMLAHFVSTGPMKLSFCRPCKKLSIAIIPDFVFFHYQDYEPKTGPSPSRQAQVFYPCILLLPNHQTTTAKVQIVKGRLTLAVHQYIESMSFHNQNI